MTPGKQFKRNIFSNAGATAIGSAVQLAMVSVFARYLDVDGFAGYLTAAAIIAVAEMGSDFGTRIWATQTFALPQPANRILRIALKSKIFYSVIGALILLLIPVKVLSNTNMALSILVAATQPSTDPLLWYLRGRERLDVEAAIVLSWRVVTAAAMALAAFTSVGLGTLLVIWLAGNVLRIAVSSRLPIMSELFSGGLFASEPSYDVAKIIKATFPIGAAFILMSLYQRLGVLGLNLKGTLNDVAVFGGAFTLVASSGFIATSITVSSFPRIAVALESKDWGSFNSLINSKLSYITWVIAPMCLAGIVLSSFVMPLLFGARYKASSVVMILLMPGLYVSCMNFALKYVLNIIGLNWFDLASVSIGMAVFMAVLLSPARLPLYQTAALAWGIGELAVFLSKWAVLIRFGRHCSIELYRPLLILFALSGMATIWYSYVI